MIFSVPFYEMGEIHATRILDDYYIVTSCYVIFAACCCRYLYFEHQFAILYPARLGVWVSLVLRENFMIIVFRLFVYLQMMPMGQEDEHIFLVISLPNNSESVGSIRVFV
jgi:hypothetical protein